MAHRGKFFPVNFRRDFNANCDIRSTTALAQAYSVDLHSGVEPPYPVDGTHWIVRSIDQPNPSTVAWLSDLSDISGQTYQLRLWVEIIEPVGCILRVTWFLFKNDFLASSWRPNAGDRFDPFQSHFQPSWQVLFTDFATFPRGANFNFSSSGPTGY